MKFLVTGSTGLVGRQVTRDLSSSENSVYSCFYKNKPQYGMPIPFDLTNEKSIVKTIEKVKPDIIIHLAAMTDVDLCEANREIALQVNSTATEILCKQAKKSGSYFLYISTDYVFDGKHGLKKEDDTPSPVDFYGKSKHDGEKAVKSITTRWCIARTSTPYGLHPTKKSFPVFVAENLLSGKEINGITDQFTSPTYVPNLSKMLIEICSRQIEGILHVAGSTRVSRYDVAEMIAERLRLEKSLIKPTKISEMRWYAKRPHDSSLDISKAISILKEKPMSVEQGLDLFVQEFKQKPN